MMTRRFLVVMGLVGTVFVSLHASEDWIGLWRLTRYSGDRVEAIDHIHFAGETRSEITVYGGEGSRQLLVQKCRLEGDHIELAFQQSPKQPLPLVITGQRKGERISGVWKFFHFQLEEPLQGRVEAVRVHHLRDWNPWETLNRRRGEGIIDIRRFLLGNAPAKDFDAFLEFWDDLEPAYYFLTQKWLYRPDSDSESHRNGRLREVFQSLSAEPPERSLVESFGSIASSALSRRAELIGSREGHEVLLVSDFSGDPIRQYSLWSKPADLQAEKDCACTLSLNETFISVDPTVFGSGGDWDRVSLRLAVYRAVLWPEEDGPQPGRGSSGLEALRRGLALRMALEDEERSWPARTSEELLSLARQAASQVELPPPWAGDPLTVLGYDFLASLNENSKTWDLAGTERREAEKLWIDYRSRLEPKDER